MVSKSVGSPSEQQHHLQRLSPFAITGQKKYTYPIAEKSGNSADSTTSSSTIRRDILNGNFFFASS